jgi:ankyrin repeat protein
MHGSIALVEQILQLGVRDINLADSSGKTALSLACRYKHYDIAVMLVEHGANYSSELLSSLSSEYQTKLTGAAAKRGDHGGGVESRTTTVRERSPRDTVGTSKPTSR